MKEVIMKRLIEYFVGIGVLLVVSTNVFGQSLAGVDPDEAQQGQSLRVTIAGQNTNFQQGSSTVTDVWFSQGSSTIYASFFDVFTNTILSAFFDIPEDAPTGLWDVNVRRSIGGKLTLNGGFTISPSDKPPVNVRPWILVHGWDAGPDKWRRFEDVLEQNNIAYAKADLGPDANPNVRARRLAEEIDMIRLEKDWHGKIDLICHSQGGLDARAYVRDMGASANVGAVVMIGTPNHGTGLAWWRSFFKPFESPPLWLTPWKVEQFNKYTPRVEGVDYFTIAGSKEHGNPLFLFAANDGVVPVSSVALTGAESLGVFPYEHNQLITDSDAIRDVFQAVKDKIDPVFVTDVQPVGLIKVVRGRVEPAETNLESVIVDNLNETAFVLLSDRNLSFSLKSPSGQLLTPETKDPNISYLYFSDWSLGLLQTSYIIKRPCPGVWTARVGESAGACDFILSVIGDTTSVLNAGTDKYVYGLHETVTISGKLGGDGVLSKIDAQITKPDRSEEVIHLYDDGSHNDGAANDGLYGNTFAPTIEGDYYLVFSAEGGVGVQEFSRSAFEGFAVVPNWIEVENIASEQAVDIDGNALYDHLGIKVLIDVRQVGSYSAYGLLRRNKKEVARSLPVSGELSSGTQMLELGFLGKDIYSSGVNGPYSLDLTFIDANGAYVGYEDNAHKTQPYSFTEFEATGEQPSNKLEADINADFRVDFLDVAILCSHWLEEGCDEPDWCEHTDLDYTGSVDFLEWIILGNSWLRSGEGAF
jgi:pimeloyl-ACP methyl ester carboxylesterase